MVFTQNIATALESFKSYRKGDRLTHKICMSTVLVLAFLLMGDRVYGSASIRMNIGVRDFRPASFVKYEAELFIHEDKLKLDATHLRFDSKKTDLIYHGEQRVVYYVNHTDESYLEFSERAIVDLSEQLEKAAAFFRKRMGSAPVKTEAPAFRTLDANSTAIIDGIRCRRYLVFRNETLLQEIWAAAWEEVGLEKPRLKSLRQLGQSYDRVMNRFGGTGFLQNIVHIPLGCALAIEGYITAIKHFDNDKVIFDIKVGAPQETTKERSFYLVPQAYRKAWEFR
jgi:hypothetical protein